MKKYYPEGANPNIEKIKRYFESEQEIKKAFQLGEQLEARAVLCDKDHNLHVDLHSMKGFMPHDECALGIKDGSVRDIAVISRVNKPVCFKIIDIKEDENGSKTAILSRSALQGECIENYINTLSTGDIIDARITHLESFGAFCDIGAGISALMPIDSISVSRIPHPSVRFSVNQNIKAVVKSIDENGRITLSHKELLGTWRENANCFCAGETVPGIIRSIESYGIFVELTPNLAGLAEFVEGPKAGDNASVFIKSINPEKMKIKLIIVDCFSGEIKNSEPQYFIDQGHIESWTYSPEESVKEIKSSFSELC